MKTFDPSKAFVTIGGIEITPFDAEMDMHMHTIQITDAAYQCLKRLADSMRNGTFSEAIHTMDRAAKALLEENMELRRKLAEQGLEERP
jgi:predicted CopG family antitoxin